MTLTEYNSSNARKLKVYENEYTMPLKSREKQVGERKTSVKEKSVSKGRFMQRLAVVLICFTVSFFVVQGYVQINEAENQITALKKELRMIEAENQAIKAKIDKSVDLKNLQSIASEKFGMVRPENYQIFYMDLDADDYIEDISEKEKKNYDIPVESVTGVLISSTDIFR